MCYIYHLIFITDNDVKSLKINTMGQCASGKGPEPIIGWKPGSERSNPVDSKTIKKSSDVVVPVSTASIPAFALPPKDLGIYRRDQLVSIE